MISWWNKKLIRWLDFIIIFCCFREIQEEKCYIICLILRQFRISNEGGLFVCPLPKTPPFIASFPLTRVIVFVSFRSDADLRHAASRLRLRWVVCFVQVCSRRSSKQPNQPLLLPPTTLPNRLRNRYKPKQKLISTTTTIAAATLLKTPMVIISWLTTLKKVVSMCLSVSERSERWV